MSRKTILQKLFLKENDRFMLLNDPPGYGGSLGELPAGVELLGKGPGMADVVQLFVTRREELLRQMDFIIGALDPVGRGILWVTYPKGSSKIGTDLNRDSINDLLLTLGFKGVAIIAVDEDWSAIRFKRVQEV